MNINQDCRFFKNDRPCTYHKNYGVVCAECKHYAPIDYKILIIKLDAMGDVLRTTCILQGLKEKYPNSQIHWITKSESKPLLENNPFIDSVLSYDESILFVLLTEEYNLVINPDASPTGARLAMISKCEKKLGFGFNPKGYVYAFNSEAEYWFAMGLNDVIKKSNNMTYQQIVLSICQLNPKKFDTMYYISPEEKSFLNNFKQKYNLKPEDIIIGLNTGAGQRWPRKQWTVDGYLKLIRIIREKIPIAKILLYGGTEAADKNKYLKAGDNDIIDTGCHNTLRQFAALLDLSSIVVTGDTLALHLALALDKKVVVLFGPTSHKEIDLYNRGLKIVPELGCIVCYKQECDLLLNCMETISPDAVFTGIEQLIGK